MVHASTMNGNFLGLPFALPTLAVAGVIYFCGFSAFWTAYRAVRTGVHMWENERTSRQESPKIFIFQMGITVLIGFAALAGATIMTFDLGMKP